jgi:heme/copper-type cytochrome/quinol oxidase subunit 2
MDTSGRETNNLTKAILTYLCSSLSIIGLIITMIIILKPRKTGKRDLRMESNRKLRDIIACNLCICLLIVNILVVSALNRLDIKVKILM